MNKQSKAAFWEGSDQSYEIMSRSHEERGKEIIALKARITELEKDNKQLRKNMKWQTDGWKKSSDLVVKDGVTIATLREALEHVRGHLEQIWVHTSSEGTENNIQSLKHNRLANDIISKSLEATKGDE